VAAAIKHGVTVVACVPSGSACTYTCCYCTIHAACWHPEQQMPGFSQLFCSMLHLLEAQGPSRRADDKVSCQCQWTGATAVLVWQTSPSCSHVLAWCGVGRGLWVWMWRLLCMHQLQHRWCVRPGVGCAVAYGAVASCSAAAGIASLLMCPIVHAHGTQKQKRVCFLGSLCDLPHVV
jgi:hypothetical protein